MHFGNIFFISLCSKRSTKLIQRVGWRHLKEIKYHSSFPNEGVHLSIYYIDKQNNDFDALSVHLNFPRTAETTSVTVFGSNLRCSYPVRNGLALKIFLNKDEKTLFTMIHDQIDALFGFQLRKIMEGREPFCAKETLPMNLNVFRRSYVFCKKELGIQELEDYFEMIGEQDIVKLHNPFFYGRLNSNSKLFDTKTLIVHAPEEDLEFILANFKGQDVTFTSAEFECQSIAKLLKKWKTQNGYENLERIQIEAYIHSRFILDIFERELDIKKLPDSFSPPAVSLYAMTPLDPSDVIISTYITRDNGIIGLLSVTPEMLVFSVKRITEKEMVERNSVA